jgi:hypothetical protein
LLIAKNLVVSSLPQSGVQLQEFVVSSCPRQICHNRAEAEGVLPVVLARLESIFRRV